MNEINPLASAAIGSIFRHVLSVMAGALVARGIWTPEDASTYVAAAAAGLVALAWSLYQKFRADRVIGVALGMPSDSTRADLKRAL